MTAELKSKSDISIVLMFFAALGVLGVFSAGFVVHDYARARASASWPSVEGIVLSRLEGDHSRVRYVYSYDGRSYESTRERVFLARFLKPAPPNYLPGETLAVFVNPKNHAYAVLYPGGAGAAFVLFFILSGACVFFGVGGVVWTLSQGAGETFLAALDAA